MASMFGKPRAGGERPPQSPLVECNVAILGCRGAGKSGETGARPPRGWPGIGGGRGATGGCPPHPPLLPPAALTVKFLTKRFISEYDPNLGKKDAFSACFPPVVPHEFPRSILPISCVSYKDGI